MKLLYITSQGKQVIDAKDNKVYDLLHTSTTIVDEIQSAFGDIEITFIADLVPNDNISLDVLKSYDIFLCDVTGGNGNVLFTIGRVDSIGKPIIFIASNEYTIPVTIKQKRILRYTDASIKTEFFHELSQLLRLAKTDPSKLIDIEIVENTQPKAFISYSHMDKKYLDRLLVHLKPLTKKGTLDVWVDTKIKTGDRWKEKIENALQESNIVILLISADFMASDFIVDNELPPLLAKAEVEGTRIISVILSPCRFDRETELNRFQAANSPSLPLSGMPEDEREKIYDQIAKDIENSMVNS